MTKEELREYNKKYREAHIEELREYDKKYYLEHKEECKAKAKEWNSAKEAASELGFCVKNIFACCKGKRKTYKGYRWSYEPL